MTLTNKEFANSDTFFQACCKAVGLKPTARQASKWRRQKGKARLAKHDVKIVMEEPAI